MSNPVITGVVNRDGQWPGFDRQGYSFGGPYEIPWQAVPTALTDIETITCRILAVRVYNSTGSPITFTIQTKDASPLALQLTGAIAANTSVLLNDPGGVLSTGGFSVQASGAGLLFSTTWTH